MSDFLNKFTKDSYQELLDELEKKKELEEVSENGRVDEQHDFEDSEIGRTDFDDPDVVLRAKTIVNQESGERQGDVENIVESTNAIKWEKQLPKTAEDNREVEGPMVADSNIIIEDSVDIVDEGHVSHEFLLGREERRVEVSVMSEDSVVDDRGASNGERYTGRSKFAEEVELDPQYHKRKLIRYGMITGASVLACASIFLLYFLMNRVTMPNFVNKPYPEMQTWALKNRMELDAEEAFSTKVDTGAVIEQSKLPDKKVSKGSVIQVKVSKGADPDELLDISKIKSMNGSALEKWKDTNKADGLKIVKEFNDKEPEGKVLRMEFKNPNEVNEKKYRRKDILTVYVSKGKEIFEKNIEVPNFKGKMLEEVEEWATINEITLEIEHAPSDTIQPNGIISQGIAAKEKVAKRSKMKIVVSQGKGVVVPWFGNLSKEEAQTAGNEGLAVIIREWYSEDVAFGGYISQDVSAGTELFDEDDKTIIVYYSAGRPFIEDLLSMNEKQLEEYFYDFQNKGASIGYTISYEPNKDVPRGQVIRSNKMNEFVGLHDHIYIVVSTG